MYCAQCGATAQERTEGESRYLECEKCGGRTHLSPARGKGYDTELLMAVGGLLLNAMLLPGAGTILIGKNQDGIWQLSLWVGSLAVTTLSLGCLFFIGIPLMLAAWGWALYTSVTHLINLNRTRSATA